MACGDRYEHLIVTPSNGYTPGNAWGSWSTPFDVSDWNALADSLAMQASREITRLASAESSAGVEEPQAPELESRLALLAERIDALPSGMGVYLLSGPKIEETIGEYIAACREAVCLLDLATQALEGLGLQVNPAGGGSAAPSKGGGLLMAGGLVALGWFLFSRYGGD